MAAMDAPEDILLFYSGTSELNPPMKYRMHHITYQHVGDGVFLITLNDPKRLNCMSQNLVLELLLVIEHAKRDERCKVIVWTGAGRAFCSGGNFTDPTVHVPDGIWDGYVHAGLALPLPDISAASQTRAMIRFPKVSIVAVNGLTLGGGTNIALLWNDISFVAEDVTFKYPFTEFGLTPELGSSVLLGRIIGLTRAKRLIQLGVEFTAKEALEWGLCTEVVRKEDVLSKALAAAKSLATKPQGAMRESKRLMNRDLIESIDRITEDEYHTIAKVMATPETQKAMMKVMAKTAKSNSKL